MTKQEIRRQVRALRRDADASWIEQASTKVADRVLRLDAVSRAAAVGLYASLPGEVSTDAIAGECRRRGATLALPAWRPEEGCYGFALWDAGVRLEPGPGGVPEPAPARWIERDALDVLIVPGVGFDAAGVRVGYGRGHYDRLLSGSGCPWKVGVCFEFQVFGQVPMEAGDVRMDVVVTEERVIHVAGRPAVTGR